ncbi:uncharacterized protein BDR25DRAFT_394617 [Lindgomyces ingoldianus]|uniref:Uncharacterized protein n=1 Tax=Lindgomyces ingoldianus TaxID=673940 RepID=A0ACB6QPG8_9PLEO|nr:uncharacterized protein BDR25DRAFT_394617 [Lindgomyces ingoldianus]KAF2468796.1 hypothetical protein BDR25DRAFT_394617 [Lindgomyces ingoldianus]
MRDGIVITIFGKKAPERERAMLTLEDAAFLPLQVEVTSRPLLIEINEGSRGLSISCPINLGLGVSPSVHNTSLLSQLIPPTRLQNATLSIFATQKARAVSNIQPSATYWAATTWHCSYKILTSVNGTLQVRLRSLLKLHGDLLERDGDTSVPLFFIITHSHSIAPRCAHVITSLTHGSDIHLRI